MTVDFKSTPLEPLALKARVVQFLVVVEASVEPFDLMRGHEIEEVLVHVRADQVATTLLKAGIVELIEERGEPRRDNRVEDDVGAARRNIANRLSICPRGRGEVRLADDIAAIRLDGSRTFLFMTRGQM